MHIWSPVAFQELMGKDTQVIKNNRKDMYLEQANQIPNKHKVLCQNPVYITKENKQMCIFVHFTME